MHNYHDVFNMFPVSMGWSSPVDMDRRMAFSDKVYMLPYLDQAPIYNQTNFNDFPWNPWNTGSNLAQSSRLPVFNCPSNGYVNANGPNGNFTYAISVGVLNYAPDGTNVVSGRAQGGYGWDHNGVACYTNWPGESMQTVSVAAVSDGTSSTAAYSEFGMVPCNPAESKRQTMQMHNWVTGERQPHQAIRQQCLNTVGHVGDCGRHNGRGSSWASSFVGFGGAYSHNMNPNEKPCFQTEHHSDWRGSTLMSASSFHEGGVHTLMADGSVHFVSENIDYNVWVGLGTRNGQETVSFP
jgi:hypothetical protein